MKTSWLQSLLLFSRDRLGYSDQNNIESQDLITAIALDQLVQPDVHFACQVNRVIDAVDVSCQVHRRVRVSEFDTEVHH